LSEANPIGSRSHEKNDVETTLAFIDGLPQGATTSMQRDVMEGRPSELEAQTGTVVRIAAALAVPVPTDAFIYAALKPMETRARLTG